MSDHIADQLFFDGQYDEAAKHLEKGVEKQGENGRDLLLYMLDLGLALHTAGKFEESNRVFLQTDKLAEIKDYTSISAESATLLATDNIKDYKAEDFENVMINTYLAMNYALLNDYENALVEARRVNRKLQLMVTDGQRKYKQNAFARYISAIIYEAEQNYNDAYVDYKKTRELEPSFPGLGRDLWRTAWLLGMPDEMERWDKEFNLSRDDHAIARELDPKKGKAEIVIFFENGLSPAKAEHPSFHSIPHFVRRNNPVAFAMVDVDGQELAKTSLLYDVESTAIQNLDEKYAGIIARKVAGIVAKEVVAAQVGNLTKNEDMRAITSFLLHLADRADLRSWQLLPKDLQVARIVVEPGTHTIRLRPQGATNRLLPEKTVQVGKGKKVFIGFRYSP